MALTVEQLKNDIEVYLRKLVGILPVGHYWFGIDPKSKPAGVQLYSGQTLSRSAYRKHWEFVSGGNRTVLSEAEWQMQVSVNGFCPYYSSGDGSTTYRMPLVKGVHPKFVSALLEAGAYTAAGLPDHEHFIANTDSTTTYNSLSSSNTLVKTGGAGDAAAWLAGTNTGASIGKTNRASASDPIYGKSDTVQPPAINIVMGEYVIGTIAKIGEANAESLLASVTTLESSISAVENGVGRASAYIVETWRSGTEWYRKWSDGWIEQGGRLTTTTQRQIVTLHKAFANDNYIVLQAIRDATASGSLQPFTESVQSMSTTSFTLYCDGSTVSRMWYACGY